MGMPSGMELFVVVAVIVLLFGGKKIPELASGLGKGIKNFKNAVKDEEPVVKATTSDEKIEASTTTTEATQTETKTTV